QAFGDFGGGIAGPDLTRIRQDLFDQFAEPRVVRGQGKRGGRSIDHCCPVSRDGYHSSCCSPMLPSPIAFLMNSSIPDPTVEAEFDENGYDRPSKSQIKRDMHALLDLGKQLIELSDDRLKQLPLAER